MNSTIAKQPRMGSWFQSHHRFGRVAAAIAALLGVAALLGCAAGSGGANSASSGSAALRRYLAQVEPIRLAVNKLLDGADPTLIAYGHHRLSRSVAQRRIGSLERRFGAYTVQINGLASAPAPMRAAQRAYAHTYVLEDAYLSALVAAIPGRSFQRLPNTQNAQRTAIIAWRTRLEVLAERLGMSLPADIDAAGRGEIAPSPLGS